MDRSAAVFCSVSLLFAFHCDLFEDAFLFHITSSPVIPPLVFVKRVIIFCRNLSCPCRIAFYVSNAAQILQLFDSNPVFQCNCRPSQFVIIRDFHKSHTSKNNHLCCPPVSQWLSLWECNLSPKLILENFLLLTHLGHLQFKVQFRQFKRVIGSTLPEFHLPL